jgi:hypothetical protein
MASLTLSSEKIAETIVRLSARIKERFPQAGLFAVSLELVAMGEAARRQVESINRPIYPVRITVAVLVVLIVAIVIALITASLQDVEQLGKASVVEILTAIESGSNEIVLIGLAILFLVTLETRIKRSRTLVIIHELRSLAHVVDMHQLTKDPGYYRGTMAATESSPLRELSLPEMIRYLEYCSELLSITSKIAALYAQEMNDRVVLSAVSDVENLVTGLTRKVWQKIDIASEIQYGGG